jgi:hypothetical protein
LRKKGYFVLLEWLRSVGSPTSAVVSHYLPSRYGKGRPSVAPGRMHCVIAGRTGVTPEMTARLEKALGSTADTWLRMQMNYDLAQIRARESSIKVKRLAPA